MIKRLFEEEDVLYTIAVPLQMFKFVSDELPFDVFDASMQNSFPIGQTVLQKEKTVIADLLQFLTTINISTVILNLILIAMLGFVIFALKNRLWTVFQILFTMRWSEKVPVEMKHYLLAILSVTVFLTYQFCSSLNCTSMLIKESDAVIDTVAQLLASNRSFVFQSTYPIYHFFKDDLDPDIRTMYRRLAQDGFEKHVYDRMSQLAPQVIRNNAVAIHDHPMQKVLAALYCAHCADNDMRGYYYESRQTTFQSLYGQLYSIRRNERTFRKVKLFFTVTFEQGLMARIYRDAAFIFVEKYGIGQMWTLYKCLHKFEDSQTLPVIRPIDLSNLRCLVIIFFSGMILALVRILFEKVIRAMKHLRKQKNSHKLFQMRTKIPQRAPVSTFKTKTFMINRKQHNITIVQNNIFKIYNYNYRQRFLSNPFH